MNSTWQRPLRDLLAAGRGEPGRTARLAIVGIGNELCADDAAGVLALRALKARLVEDPARLLIEGGSAPENVTGRLRQFKPDAVLFIDAAEMGQSPGAVRWVGMDEIDGLSASTHSLPLSMFARYLAAELGCGVGLLGLQPVSTQMGESPSREVRQAVAALAQDLQELLPPVLAP